MIALRPGKGSCSDVEHQSRPEPGLRGFEAKTVVGDSLDEVQGRSPVPPQMASRRLSRSSMRCRRSGTSPSVSARKTSSSSQPASRVSRLGEETSIPQDAGSPGGPSASSLRKARKASAKISFSEGASI